MNSLVLALQFLTRIPVRVSVVPTESELGRSVLYYPLIGLLIGLLTMSTAMLLHSVSVPLQTALSLTIWILLTGGLHLDGLADCADAWAGGLGDREKTVAIMKDPAAGPAAVVTLVMLLFLKWAALQSMTFSQMLLALVVAPVVGRTAVLALMLSTPYVSKNGLAEVLIAYLPTREAKIQVVVVALALVYLVGPAALLLAAATLFWIRMRALLRLGGVTGDVYGAAVELAELAVLLGVALNE